MFTRRFGIFLFFVLFITMLSACGQVPDIPDIPDIPGIGEGEDVSDDITHEMTIEYDLATYSLYTSMLDYEETEEEFAAYLEDQGYTLADEEEVDKSFFIQYGDGTSAGGAVYEEDDYYLYVYITGDADGAMVYTVGTTKENYEGYKEGDLDEGQLDDEDNDEDPDEDPVPEEDTAEGEEIPDLDRHPGAVMVSHTKVVLEDETDYYIEYLVEGDLRDVFDFYEDELEAAWVIDDQWFVAGEGGQFIAYLGDAYGLTLAVELEDEEMDIIRIHVYASEYHDDE